MCGSNFAMNGGTLPLALICRFIIGIARIMQTFYLHQDVSLLDWECSPTLELSHPQLLGSTWTIHRLVVVFDMYLVSCAYIFTRFRARS